MPVWLAALRFTTGNQHPALGLPDDGRTGATGCLLTEVKRTEGSHEVNKCPGAPCRAKCCELVLRLQSGVGGTERVLYPVDGFLAVFVRINRDNVEAHHAISILRSHRRE